MTTISPIKDRNVLEKMKEYLREQNIRNYLLFRIGINLGLPVQELLHLRVEDILGKSEVCFGDYQIRISETLQKEIEFSLGKRKTGYVFKKPSNKPLSRFQLYNIIKDAAAASGFKGAVGALTLRKTFAYWAYKEQLIYLPLLSKYLGHHTVTYTLNFMEEDMNEEPKGIGLGPIDL